jgi:hypothetical protein
MVLDIGITDVLSIAQTVGIVGTLLIALFLSRREVRELSIDIETKVLSDLDEKVHRLEEHLLERPELASVINNVRRISSIDEGRLRYDMFVKAYDDKGGSAYAMPARFPCA